MATKDRLKEFLSTLKIGRNKFEAQLGLANGYVSSKGASISSDVIEKRSLHILYLMQNGFLQAKEIC